MNNETTSKKHFNSRFGYIMVAAGAAIGLGNIWQFPSVAYTNGGGAFVFVYLIIAVLLGYPVVQIESALGRYARTNAIDAYGKINPKWKFLGIINVVCTIMIDMYYMIVSGYMVKYMVAYATGGHFGTDKVAFYNAFISDPIQPLVYGAIVVAITGILLSAGITEKVEACCKIILPALLILLIICSIWALIITPDAIKGVGYYLLPNPETFTIKSFADACMQIMFSVGIGWAIFITLGASMSPDANLKKDSAMVVICDTAIALLAGFVIIPAVVGSGSEMSSGPSLIFIAMTTIFSKFAGGTIIGFFFFLAVVFAVLSTCFTIVEIPVKCMEEKCHMSHPKATLLTSLIIFAGGILCSLSQGTGLLSGLKLPWWNFDQGVIYYNLYDWVNSFSAYVLLPLGCLLMSVFCWKVWGWENLEKELTNNGKYGKLSKYDKVIISVVVPILTVIVILHIFGFDSIFG